MNGPGGVAASEIVTDMRVPSAVTCRDTRTPIDGYVAFPRVNPAEIW
jgi:hypothetical protein